MVVFKPQMIIFSLFSVYHYLVLSIKTNLANKIKDRDFCAIRTHIEVSESYNDDIEEFIKWLVMYVVYRTEDDAYDQQLAYMHDILGKCQVTCDRKRYAIITECITMTADELLSHVPHFSHLNKEFIQYDMVNGDEVLLTYVEE